MRGNVYISVEAERIVERILADVYAIEFFLLSRRNTCWRIKKWKLYFSFVGRPRGARGRPINGTFPYYYKSLLITHAFSTMTNKVDVIVKICEECISVSWRKEEVKRDERMNISLFSLYSKDRYMREHKRGEITKKSSRKERRNEKDTPGGKKKNLSQLWKTAKSETFYHLCSHYWKWND